MLVIKSLNVLFCSKNDDKLNYLMKMADEDIKRLIIDKNKISEQIDKSINM